MAVAIGGSRRATILNSLKPCPFCGSKNLGFSLKVFSRQRYKTLYHACIFCKSCNCYGRRTIISTDNRSLSDADKIDAEEKAIELWNKRAI